MPDEPMRSRLNAACPLGEMACDSARPGEGPAPGISTGSAVKGVLGSGFGEAICIATKTLCQYSTLQTSKCVCRKVFVLTLCMW